MAVSILSSAGWRGKNLVITSVFGPKMELLNPFYQLISGLLRPFRNPVRCHLDAEFMLVSISDGNQTFSINRDRSTPGSLSSNSEMGLYEADFAFQNKGLRQERAFFGDISF